MAVVAALSVMLDFDRPRGYSQKLPLFYLMRFDYGLFLLQRSHICPTPSRPALLRIAVYYKAYVSRA